ncbi:MAG TPA: copper amine oxidase N-terminal domain-containing protein [Abditibacterium sp.]
MKINIRKNVVQTGALTVALGAGFAVSSNAQPAPQVYLNGTPLRLEVAPIQQNGRTLVPMRDIFEALGATVAYNSLNQSIAAQKGTTVVRMALGTSNASVNNVPIKLDAPAQAYYGRTMVPLRFVSEALGANVSFNAGNRIVSINSNGIGSGDGTIGGGTQVAGIRQISIPAQSVVPVVIDQEITSANAYRGQTFSATVSSDRPGDSEFPAGTRLEGTVAGVTKRSGANPGVLDLRFNGAILPDGTRVPLVGDPISLDNESVVATDGRIVASAKAKKNNNLKIIGIGAGAGFVIGRILKKDGALPAILGAAGGFLFDRLSNKNQVADARLTAGTKVGVRLRREVSYRDTTGYYDQRSNYVKL